MDTSIIAAFTQAATTTFRDMFGIAAALSGTAELSSSQEEHGWDITGLVGLAGQAQGVVAIRLPQPILSTLLSGSGVSAAGVLEGRQLESGLVGEMMNIIAGSAVSAIRDLNIEIAPPVIVRGPNHKIGWPSIAPVIALSFGIPSGSFEIDLCVRH
jgi:chemotaxis protein CheX